MTFLWHGTRYPKQIIATDKLLVPQFGDRHVSLTTDHEVAIYWARMPRDDDDGYGATFCLNVEALQKAGYDLTPFVSGNAAREEHEIACHREITDLHRYVVSMIPFGDE